MTGVIMKLTNKRFFNMAVVLGVATLAVINHRGSIHGKVVCFGDSITHGAKVDGQSWVYFLEKDHGKSADFINAGRNGRKTSDKEELLPVLKKYPDAGYYLIFLGVNDLKNGTDEMVDDCVKNMKWMIAQIRKTDPKADIVILAPSDINLKTMAPINIRKKYNENTRKSLYELEKRYKELANEDHLGFISLLHTVSSPNYADGLHPNIRGQKQIAAKVWEGLNELYN